jgi:hypothetical protein
MTMRSTSLTGEGGEGVEEGRLDALSPLVGGRGQTRVWVAHAGATREPAEKIYQRQFLVHHQYNRLKFTPVLSDPWKKFIVDESGGLEHHLKGCIRVC